MFIYLITNIITGKYYVGQTTRTVQVRWKKHIHEAKTNNKKYLSRAIQKYGSDNFRVDVLCKCPDKRALNDCEKFFIKMLGSSKPSFGYNMTLGGEGLVVTEELRERLRLLKIGKPKGPRSEEHRANLSKSHLGLKMSEESKVKNRDAHFGKKLGPMPQQTKDKISKANKGKTPWSKTPEESRKKRIVSLKKAWAKRKLEKKN
jgi:group I intron endonuclease